MWNKIKSGGLTALVAIIILIMACGVSWIATCGLIKLITMCFGLTFTWGVATGIWLILVILQSVFKTTTNK